MNHRLIKFSIALVATMCFAVGFAQTRIAFVPQIQGIPYYVAMEEGANAAVERFGEGNVVYTQQGPQSTNASDQLRIFNSFVNQGYDVISVSPVDADSLSAAIARAAQRGLHPITSDADAPNSEREVFVAQATDQALGYTLMDELASRIDESGKVAIVSDAPTIQSLNNWIAAIKERAASEYPDIEIVSTQHTDGTTAQAFEFAQQAMSRHSDLKAIIGIASTTCPGVARAVEEADMIGQVVTTGYCSPNTVRQFIKSGAMPFSVLWNPADLGYLMVWAALEIVAGNEFQEMNEVPGLEDPAEYRAEEQMLILGPPTVFTPENVDDFDFGIVPHSAGGMPPATLLFP